MIVFDGTFTGIGGGVAAAAFVVVFVVCLRVLPEMGFTGASQKVLAFCVAALSAIGIVALGPEGSSAGPTTPESSTVHFVLLPYAALGLTLLLLIFFLLMAGWFERLRQVYGRYIERPRYTQKESGQIFRTRELSDHGRIGRRRENRRS